MPSAARLTKFQYETLAALRHALTGFLLFSQDAARTVGLTPHQHQALLAITGFPGRDYVSVGELAAALHLRPHSAVGLVNRLVLRKLAHRQPSLTDRRRVEVRLTARGGHLLDQISATHWRELKQLGPTLRQALDSIARSKPPRSKPQGGKAARQTCAPSLRR